MNAKINAFNARVAQISHTNGPISCAIKRLPKKLKNTSGIHALSLNKSLNNDIDDDDR